MTYISKSESVNFIVAYLQIDVGELFQLFKGLNKLQLPDICSDLKTAIPEPMNTMLEKEAQEVAIMETSGTLIQGGEGCTLHHSRYIPE